MLVSNLVFLLIILTVLGFNGYLVWAINKTSRQNVAQLDYEHSRAILLIKDIAEHAIEHVKAASLVEREQVRAAREANNVQINQLRDIIKKQAEMITDQDKEPEKVKLSNGTEVDPAEYEWGVQP